MRNTPQYLVESEEFLRVHVPGTLLALEKTVERTWTHLQIAEDESLEDNKRKANYQLAAEALLHIQTCALWMAKKAEQVIQQINDELNHTEDR